MERRAILLVVTNFRLKPFHLWKLFLITESPNDQPPFSIYSHKLQGQRNSYSHLSLFNISSAIPWQWVNSSATSHVVRMFTCSTHAPLPVIFKPPGISLSQRIFAQLVFQTTGFVGVLLVWNWKILLEFWRQMLREISRTALLYPCGFDPKTPRSKSCKPSSPSPNLPTMKTNSMAVEETPCSWGNMVIMYSYDTGTPRNFAELFWYEKKI